MNLKKEQFDAQELSELSALQRVEYLEFLVKLEGGATPEATSPLAIAAGNGRKTVMGNAWLVSRALWHAAPDADVDKLMHQTLQTWPADALSAAAYRVLVLSGLVADEGQPHAGNDTPVEPLSPEKS
ncbi:MAG TPA: phage minor tail protein G [Buttiauxella sp.]|jgi:phage minor tail protein G